MQRTPNTLNAHRLIIGAGIEGRQTAAVSALFQSVFWLMRGILATQRFLADIAMASENLMPLL